MWRLRVRMCCGVLFSGLLKRLNIVVFVILDTMSGRIVTIILRMDYILMVPIMMKDILMKG